MSLIGKLKSKPWLLDQGAYNEKGGFDLPAVKVGLFIFLAVVATLFFLITSAYVMRMSIGDWRSIKTPNLLWLNTVILILCSTALQWTLANAKRNHAGNVRIGLMMAGALTVLFLGGQYMAWRELNAAGFFIANSPATAFFYFITAIHGLHLVGGLVAWARTASKVWSGMEMVHVRLSVELCALYWHFLLVVWLMMFGLLLST